MNFYSASLDQLITTVYIVYIGLDQNLVYENFRQLMALLV